MELVTVVVVPARDEQDRIGTCLEALAAQTVGVDAFETILVADGFEQSELMSPRKALEEAGAETEIVSPEADKVTLLRRVHLDLTGLRVEDAAAMLVPATTPDPALADAT